MAGRFNKRSRASSKLSESFTSGDQSKKIRDLVKALEQKDSIIAGLEAQVKELKRELEHRKRLVDDLTLERNALRQKDASLVGKLAELSRKQSVSSSYGAFPSPPRLPKRPHLPPIPVTSETSFEDSPNESVFSNGAGSTSTFNFSGDSPLWRNGIRGSPYQSNHIPLAAATTREEESDTDYSDMEDTETPTPVATVTKDNVNGDDEKSEFVNSGQVRQSDIDSVLAAVSETVKKMEMDLDIPLSPDSPKVSSPTSKGERKGDSSEESLKAKTQVEKRDPPNEVKSPPLQKRTSVEMLTAKFELVASSNALSVSSPSSKRRFPISSNRQQSPSALSDISPSESSLLETTALKKPRSSSLQNETSVSPSVNYNRTQSACSSGSGTPTENKRIISGSEGIASRIASLISGNRRGVKDKETQCKTSPIIARRTSTNGTMMNGTVTAERNGSVVQSPEVPPSSEPASNGVAKAGGEVGRVTSPPSRMVKSKQDSDISVGSDVFSSGDYSITDIESSFDFTSPPISPASSLTASSVSRVMANSSTKPVDSTSRARDAALKKFKDRETKKTARFNVEWEEGGEDKLGELLNMKTSIRERTKTLSSSTGVSSRTTVELGRVNIEQRKKERNEKQVLLKRHHSLTDLRLIRRDFAMELELISPDFESKIQDRIHRAMSEKYGGFERATQAAIKIQQSWRQLKLRSRFQKIKQQNKTQLQQQLRQRAQTMRDPRRRPSIMRKRNKAYNREKSVANVSPQLLAKANIMHGDRRGFILVPKVSSPVEIKEELVECVEEEVLEGASVLPRTSSDSTTQHKTADDSKAPKFQLNDSSVVSEPPLANTSSSSTTADSPDGLTKSASFTPGDNHSTPRPLSVFSSGSSLSPSGSYQDQLQNVGRAGGLTMPRLRPVIIHDSRDRALSVGSGTSNLLNRKKAIGINHFNRKPTKGIQYLVESQVLDDDPHSVADFLTDSTKNKLSKQKIGEFLGEISSDFNMAVLGCLLEQMDMSGKPIDAALRELQQLFRMPGEAQKIDKIMEIFALEYFKHNKDCEAVKSEDAAYILSFAIMMLHTALHNPSVKHKTTRKEWVSMNRGCNDGANFPEHFLLEIYDRIQSTEFICGQDHTQEVAEIEKQIIGATNANLPKLSTPQRHLVMKINVNEIFDLNIRRQRHRRTLFMFNDLVVLCKQRRHEQYHCKQFFPLLHVLPVKFDTEHHRNGVQLHSSIERKIILQCTCDTLEERTNLMDTLDETIKELEEMEKERIEELGTSLNVKPQEVHLGGSVRHSSSSRGLLHAPNSLASTSLTDLRKQTVAEESELGDSDEHNQLRPNSSISARNNRSSGDSGFDSPQQNTPVATPTPSPTEQDHVEATDSMTPSPSPSPTPSPSLVPPTSPNARTARSSISHSRSHDGLRTLTVYPSVPDRSPSAEPIRGLNGNPSPTPSPKKSTKKDKSQKEPKEKVKKSHYVNIFSIGRAKGKDIKAASVSPGASPVHKKRRASESPGMTHSTTSREASSSPPGHNSLSQSFRVSSNDGLANASDKLEPVNSHNPN